MRTATARLGSPELDIKSSAFKVFFMATLKYSIGPFVKLLAAVGAVSSLLLLGLLNLFS